MEEPMGLVCVWERGQSQTGDADTLIQPLNPRLVGKGRGVYQENCAQCHGLRGKGSPTGATKMLTAPTRRPMIPQGTLGITAMVSSIALFGTEAKSTRTRDSKARCPHLATGLNPEEVKAVITYLKSLWGPKERGFQSQVSLEDPFPEP